MTVVDHHRRTIIGHCPPRRGTSSSLRTLAGVSLVLAAASAIVTATIDAASVAVRISGQVIESRPLWLHTFSVAVVTMAVTAFALWGGRSAVTVQAQVAYTFTAALNISVLLLRHGHADFRFVLPVVHVVLAALLISLSLVARRHAS